VAVAVAAGAVVAAAAVARLLVAASALARCCVGADADGARRRVTTAVRPTSVSRLSIICAKSQG
jgi:hypothetical protein